MVQKMLDSFAACFIVKRSIDETHSVFGSAIWVPKISNRAFLGEQTLYFNKTAQ